MKSGFHPSNQLEHNHETDQLMLEMSDLRNRTDVVNDSYKAVQRTLDTKIGKQSELEAEIDQVQTSTYSLQRAAENHRYDLRLYLRQHFLRQLPTGTT